ncbi:hypothetical protein ACFY0N_00720 [Streptomyces vinaceus]|uniref:hypothetical protein n=1 Tax=Streptomyces vinaceus TaxID=1960 RepID=UPI003692B74B
MISAEARVRAALMLVGRLIDRHGLTPDEAVTAVAQRGRRETGPHTDLVTLEATAVLEEAFAPIRALMDAFKPIAEAAAVVMADLARALRTAHERQAVAPHASRPAWASPYGPPPRRSFR